MFLSIIILKMHNFEWYDVAFDSACKTVRFCGTGLGIIKDVQFTDTGGNVWKIRKSKAHIHTYFR